MDQYIYSINNLVLIVNMLSYLISISVKQSVMYVILCYFNFLWIIRHNNILSINQSCHITDGKKKLFFAQFVTIINVLNVNHTNSLVYFRWMKINYFVKNV